MRFPGGKKIYILKYIVQKGTEDQVKLDTLKKDWQDI